MARRKEAAVIKAMFDDFERNIVAGIAEDEAARIARAKLTGTESVSSKPKPTRKEEALK
jgi:hypothetical protein